jgi:outer membrane immunogenic protein
MLRISLAVLASVIGASAFAADLRPYPPPAQMTPRPVFDWTGFYIGANAGGGIGTGRSDFDVGGGPGFAPFTNSMSGALGGVQAGYNRQFGSFVYGLETDFQFANIRGDIDAPTCPAAVCGIDLSAHYDQKIPWFGTVRGRVGYAAAGWLLYVTGGYAYARLETNAVASAGGVSAGFSATETRGGWTIGGGAEVALNAHWSAKVEYLYLDFGTTHTAIPFSGLPTVTDNAKLNSNVIRAGVNYRF